MAAWYVEAKPGETWSQASQHFMTWVMDNDPIRNFGCSEGDSILVGSTPYHCFDFPDRYGKDIDRFPAWARATKRLHGWAQGSSVLFAHDRTLVHTLPVRPSITPPWLR